MRLTLWSILPVLTLAACGGDAPAPAPTETAAAAVPAAPAEVSGPERRILAFGDSLFAGYGLAEDEGYPEKLQAALRARGIDAAVTDAGVSILAETAEISTEIDVERAREALRRAEDEGDDPEALAAARRAQSRLRAAGESA